MLPNWLSKILAFLLTLILIGIFGYLGVYLAMIPNFLRDRLAHWTPLGSPPEKAVKLMVAFKQPGDRTVVKTASGKYYSAGVHQKQWNEIDWPYPDSDYNPTGCPGGFTNAPPLPSPIISCDGSYSWEWERTEHYAVLLEDGTVWRWQYGTGYEFMFSLILLVVGPIIGAVGGFNLAQFIRKRVLTPARRTPPADV